MARLRYRPCNSSPQVPLSRRSQGPSHHPHLIRHQTCRRRRRRGVHGPRRCSHPSPAMGALSLHLGRRQRSRPRRALPSIISLPSHHQALLPPRAWSYPYRALHPAQEMRASQQHPPHPPRGHQVHPLQSQVPERALHRVPAAGRHHHPRQWHRHKHQERAQEGRRMSRHGRAQLCRRPCQDSPPYRRWGSSQA